MVVNVHWLESLRCTGQRRTVQIRVHLYLFRMYINLFIIRSEAQCIKVDFASCQYVLLLRTWRTLIHDGLHIALAILTTA
jgi:hypothetical protein